MKHNISKLISLALLFSACNVSDSEISINKQEIDLSDFFVYTTADDSKNAKMTNTKDSRRNCYTMTNLNRLLDENPGLEQSMYAIEYQTRKYIASKKPSGTPGGGPNTDPNPTPEPDPVPYTGVITIPLVINIIEQYYGQVTDAQVESQIAILNEDFNNLNPNTSKKVPGEFANRVADFEITFSDNPTIIRKTSSKASWGTRDAMKSSKKGGIDATDPAHNLNIWVCQIGGGVLGYAQFPGGPSATDGVVIGIDYFGETSGPYGDGRTATHEVGHWLNLRHIWGDGGCSYDDFVQDTPTSDGPNYGCPIYPIVACGSNDMTMNYMDYVYDDCMFMFTIGQNERSRALFASDGYRSTFIDWTSN
ncbi:zinc metalloprotease [Tamlana flava]|uniref:zinc metalloprotease n=1 Tax=Tamlana flava TaxID=3158572 RepID=UPI00351B18E1